jgi:hypothetical protein
VPQRRFFFTAARPEEAASRAHRDLVADEISGPTTRRRAVVGFFPFNPQIHNPWICGRRWPCEEIRVTLTLALFFFVFFSFLFFYPGHGAAA